MLQLITPDDTIPLTSPLIGRVNVYNILAASAGAYARGCPSESIADGIAKLARVPGRFERVDCAQPFTVVVDYAHTDDALRNLTSLAREFVKHDSGRVITVFGCGGNRDRSKRPLMGEAAGRGSDFVVLTSDNPRNESPLAIINDAVVGVQRSGVKYAIEPIDGLPFEPHWLRPDQRISFYLPAKGTRKFRSWVAQASLSTIVRLRQRFCANLVMIAGGRKERMKLPLGRVAEYLNVPADELGPSFNRDAVATGYSIDSRTIKPGEVFFAVRGERMDGHDFLDQAFDKGAIAAVVSRDKFAAVTANVGAGVNARPPLMSGATPPALIPVEDTLVGLQLLAQGVRRLWARPLIAVTGSAGKTTTKEAIAHVLSTRFRVHKSEGNFNNHFGLPLMLLKLEPEHDCAVVELGMSHLGEITALAQIAQPDTGVVTNVAPVHLEFFKDIAEIAAREIRAHRIFTENWHRCIERGR